MLLLTSLFVVLWACIADRKKEVCYTTCMLTKLPGLIDIHVHLRDPGQTHKEDFTTGTSAALAGGFTTIIDMPNNVNPVFTAQVLEKKMEIARGKTVADLGFHFGTLGENTDEFAKVHGKVFGLKVYLDITTGHFVINREKLEKVFKAWEGDTPILAHAEGPMVDLMVEMVRKYGKKAHIVHISSKEELESVIRAKEAGLQVTCGVCMHHLTLTQEDELRLGTYGLMKPSLKTPADREFLWQHIDAIDVIESDHAPHTREEKESQNPPFGIPGLETTLYLLLQAEAEGKITRSKVLDMCHYRPAELFKIPTDTTTFIEVDESVEHTIPELFPKDENGNSVLMTKCGWTPFINVPLRGQVVSVTIRGTEVYRHGNVLVAPGSGRVIVPSVK